MKTFTKIFATLLFSSGLVTITKAQQGFGTSNPAPSSVIDMTASNKGALLPRVALTSTTVAAPVNSPANALTVFNTATTTTGTDDVTPGYYYWSVPQMKWIRLLTESMQDLRLVGTANHITQDAGQGANGTSAGPLGNNIGIGANALLHNKGSDNIAIGANTIASAFSNVQMSKNVVVGVNAMSKGGYESVAIGYNAANKQSMDGGRGSVAIGFEALLNAAETGESVAIGYQSLKTANSPFRNATLGGRTLENAISAGSTVAIGHRAGGLVEQVGSSVFIGDNAGAPASGTSITNAIAIGANALVETSNSMVLGGVGTSAVNVGINTTAPEHKLHIVGDGNDPVRIENLQDGDPAADKIVVANTDGILKTVAASAITPGVRGGLRNNTVTGGFTELGGDLVRETIIATTISGTTYPLKITGLPFGDSDDQIMVVDNGQLKMVNQSTVAIEPWQVQGFTTKATGNTQAIYQNAKVAVGDFSVGGASGTSAKQFEVKGNFKSEMAAAGGVVGTEIGSPLNPNGAMHYWSNGTNYRIASANDFSSTLETKTGAVTNTISARDIQAALSSSNGTNSLSSIRATQAGEFFMEAYNVTGNYGATVSLLSDALRLVHGNTGGSTDPFPNNNRSELIIRKTEGIGVALRDAAGALQANYFLPTTSGTSGQVLTKSTSNTTVWANPVAEPKFFYAPSMVLPTTATDLPAGVTYSGTTFTVDLHAIYAAQFGMTGDVVGATRTAIKNASATTLPVKAVTDLEYFITYFDNTVYDPATITLSNAGILTYQILPSATVTAKTYMNIVFKAK